MTERSVDKKTEVRSTEEALKLIDLLVKQDILTKHETNLLREALMSVPDGAQSRSDEEQPASKPLTDEQRNWVVATCPTPRHIIDTVEKMHGIKGDA